MSNPRAQKRQLEMARLERAAAKRERRHARGGTGEPDAAGAAAGPGAGLSQDELLAQLAELHRRYADKQLSLEDFEAARDELVQHLRVD